MALIRLGATLIAVTALAAAPAGARDLTWVSFGGVLQDSIRDQFAKPFTADTHTPLVEDSYSGALSAVAAQVLAKNVTWDVVDLDSDVMRAGCDQGYLERIDWSKMPPKNAFIPAAVASPCGVGFLTGALVLGFDSTKFQGGEPTTWADFWNISKFPGKRGMRQEPSTTLEVALMADGVPPADVYKALATPEGVDRAFRKLDTLKPYISWWTVGAQSVQALASGEVAMTAAYSGRLIAANTKEAKHYVLAWDAGSVYFNDYWGIPKGSPNREAANAFIASTAQAPRQLAFSRASGYGPTLVVQADQVGPDLQANVLTPERLAHSVARDDGFWSEHGEELTKQFNIWASK